MEIAFLAGLLPTIGKALLGGVASGLAKRIDAQIGGKKAAQYGGTPSGGLQQIDINAATAAQHASQGQATSMQDAQMAHQRSLQAESLASQERMQDKQLAHEMSMYMMTPPYMSTDGQNDQGERGLLSMTPIEFERKLRGTSFRNKGDVVTQFDRWKQLGEEGLR